MLILNEVHKSPYSGHPGYQKMITMLRKEYFWPNMKNEVADFLDRCIECKQFKAQHQHPSGLLQPLLNPNWKREVIRLDFVTDLPKNQKQNDLIMVVMDNIIKETHFIHVKETHKDINIADIFMK